MKTKKICKTIGLILSSLFLFQIHVFAQETTISEEKSLENDIKYMREKGVKNCADETSAMKLIKKWIKNPTAIDALVDIILAEPELRAACIIHDYSGSMSDFLYENGYVEEARDIDIKDLEDLSGAMNIKEYATKWEKRVPGTGKFILKRMDEIFPNRNRKLFDPVFQEEL